MAPKKPARKKQDPDELITRHLTRCLHYLAQEEMPDEPQHHRTAIVEATVGASEEAIRTMLSGMLALNRLDVEAELDDDDDDDDIDEEDEDDEDEDDEDND